MKPGPRGYAQISGCESEIWHIYRRNCKRRGGVFNLSKKIFNDLITKRCCYCEAPPRNILRRSLFTFLYQGIDRKDNSRGYVPGNVVACCGDCNGIKGNRLSHDEMIAVAQVLRTIRPGRLARPR